MRLSTNSTHLTSITIGPWRESRKYKSSDTVRGNAEEEESVRGSEVKGDIQRWDSCGRVRHVWPEAIKRVNDNEGHEYRADDCQDNCVRNRKWRTQIDDQGNDVNNDDADIDEVLDAVRNERPNRESVRNGGLVSAAEDEETRDLQSVVSVSIRAECP